jgi:predicted nucleotidyltransferase
MAFDDFDSEEAKEFLLQREKKEREEQENTRKELLQKVILTLEKEFRGTLVESYLVGSILRPFQFSSRSDVDVVLRSYDGDRFAFWTKLEKEIGRAVEIIPFETCPFQEFVLKDGLKVT